MAELPEALVKTTDTVLETSPAGVTDAAVVCRLDTEEERQVFGAGGLLPRMRDEFLQAA